MNTSRYAHWVGMGGVPARDNPGAHHWESRLQGPMVLVALLAVPALFLGELTEHPALISLGRYIELLILAAFSGELLWMMRTSSHPLVYLGRNWLNLAIIAATVASLAGLSTEWLALARVFRVLIAGLLIARALSGLRQLLRPDSLPFVLLFGILTLLVAGGGFYALEPTVHTYWEGVWLAFVTGATVGYGDFIPTTLGSRIFAVIIVVTGVGMLSIVTASIAAFFVGEDEKQLRREFHHDIKALRDEVRSLRAQLKEAGIIAAPPPGVEHPGPDGPQHGPEGAGAGHRRYG